MMWLYYTCTIILLMIQYLNKTIVSGSKHTTIQLVSTIFAALNYNVIIIDDADFLYIWDILRKILPPMLWGALHAIGQK